MPSYDNLTLSASPAVSSGTVTVGGTIANTISTYVWPYPDGYYYWPYSYYTAPPAQPCPNCGYCPHCGQAKKPKKRKSK